MSPPAAPGHGAPPPFSSTPDPTLATATAISNLMPPPPPLLLSKRVTAFLHANLSTYIRTAALTTPAGKLLAHASNGLSASALRRQCAVAASLWGLHHPSGSGYGGDHGHGADDHHVIGSPTGSTASQSTVGTARGGAAGGGLRARPVPGQAVTVQMDNGLVFVIRRLRCGMLFICMGGEEGHGHGHGNGKQPGETEGANGGEAPPTPGHLDPGHHLPLRAGPHRTPTSSSATSARSKREADISGENTPLGTSINTAPTASTSQGSNANAVNNAAASARGPSASSVRAMRRQVEELARWLDERLGTLYVPEEGIGLGFGGSPGVEVR
ncbi:hypothetical protein B0T20DRAFT_134006 [Sordaria brevicollis]|uniref:Uncharacterized protein n=1 Tax=Sordaria brevicollis TaxID=83679 RepID=A0AAE0UFS6_SORBR|nr:hypothetical protein B0T20DRAFT_134006 [Sordaria brevicollis]